VPQPIDFHTEIARTMAVERIQQSADRASLAGQQRVAQEVAQRQDDQEHTVGETPESQNEHIDEEAKRRNPYAFRRRRRGEDDSEEQSRGHAANGEGGHLDVTV